MDVPVVLPTTPKRSETQSEVVVALLWAVCGGTSKGEVSEAEQCKYRVQSCLYLKVRYFTHYQVMGFFWVLIFFNVALKYHLDHWGGFGVSLNFAPKESTSPSSRPEKDTGLETEVVSMPNPPRPASPIGRYNPRRGPTP